MRKVQWAAARIVFLIMALAGTASGSMVSYLLGPLYSWYLFNDVRFLKHHRLFFPIAVAYWKLVSEWIRNPDYRRMFAIPWTAPPMIGPDLSRVRVRKTWPEDEGGCNGCVQCCIQRSCPMLDAEQNLCRGYSSFFWRYFNCGRYPEKETQIRYYNCPKWEVRVD
jgi:hypothetical protein